MAPANMVRPVASHNLLVAIDHLRLQPLQADPHKAQVPLPVEIVAAALASQVYSESLQGPDQHSDRHQQHQPINARRTIPATSL
jgi:hypothetical protein